MPYENSRQKNLLPIAGFIFGALLFGQLTQTANGQSGPKPIWQPAATATSPFPSFPKTTSTSTVDCKKVEWGQKCEIQIDRTMPEAPGTVLVASGTQVTIVVFNKSPFETAKFESTRTDVTPPPGTGDLIKDLLGLVVPHTRALTFFKSLTETTETIRSSSKSTLETINKNKVKYSPGSEEFQIVSLLNAIIEDASGNQKKIKAVSDLYIGLDSDLETFFKGSGSYCVGGMSSLNPDAYYTTQLNKILDKIEKLKSESLVSIEGDEVNFSTAKKLLDKVMTRAPYDSEFAVATASLINQTSGLLQLYKEAITNLNEERKSFIQLGNTLNGIKEEKCVQRIAIVADKQANIAGNVTFTSALTGKSLPQQLYTKVAFRDLPRASLSVGVMVSTMEKRSFSAAQFFDGSGQNPTDPVKRRLEISGESSKPQVIPFSFANIRITQWRMKDGFYTFNLTPGIGVNPNGGTNEVEFALGASFGFNNVYLFGGAHFGREAHLINGFSVGNRVPDGFVPPIGRGWTTNFGFGVSYRVPLP